MGLKQAPEQTGLPPAQPVELSTLVTYQTGAVVSRTLVKKNGGTVTVFAFDAGQALSEHTAPFDAIVICVCSIVVAPIVTFCTIIP